jgi:hypothetical protein
MKKVETVLVAFIISTFALVRASPLMKNGFSLSIDAMGLYRDATVLISSSPVSLFSEKFDNYNNFWPGASISASVLSVIGGFDVLLSGSILPIASFIGFALILSAISYILYKKFNLIAIVMIVGSTTSMILLSEGLIKEGIAYPLYALTLYSILNKRPKFSNYVVAFLSSSALAFTHHLTTLVFVSNAWGLFIGTLVLLILQIPVSPWYFLPYLSIALFPSILQYFLLGRFSLLSAVNFYLVVSLVIWISLLSLIAAIAFAKFNEDIELVRKLKLASISILPISLLCIRLSNLLGFADIEWTWYAIALSFSLLFLAAVFSYSQRLDDFIPWLLESSVGAIMAFSLYEDLPMKADLLGRLSTFLIPPLAISLTGFSPNTEKSSYFEFNKIKADKEKGNRILLIVGAYALIMAVTFSAVQIGLAQSPGGLWLINDGEFIIGKQLYNMGVQSVSSDIKMGYLLGSYFGLETSVYGSGNERAILLSNYMFTKGMLLSSGEIRKIEYNDIEKLFSSHSAVFSSNEVRLFVG